MIVMIEVGCVYTKPEMTRMFGTRGMENLKRKLTRYGIVFTVSGRGESAEFHIQELKDPFKVFAILELNCDANTDFIKLRNFYYYYFNDEEFMAMPDEVKEARMREQGRDVSRQTIAGYVRKLEQRDMISRNTDRFIYYFAFRQEQRMVEKGEYLEAWHEYWADRALGLDSVDAICRMYAKYGGVARKQSIPAVNGIYNKEIEYMLTQIQMSIENDIGG